VAQWRSGELAHWHTGALAHWLFVYEWSSRTQLQRDWLQKSRRGIRLNTSARKYSGKRFEQT